MSYDNKAQLLFTDTDSLKFKIETEDIYKDFWNDKELFDNSDYPDSSRFFDKTNTKIIGKFKDEAAGIPIVEFVGLRSKIYSYVKDNEEGGKTTKGIKKNVVKNDIKHKDYKNTLFNSQQMHHKMKTIRSKNHKLRSYELVKYLCHVLMINAASIKMKKQVTLMVTLKYKSQRDRQLIEKAPT